MKSAGDTELPVITLEPDLEQLLHNTVAAGNGFLSHGLYSGLAHAAELVLIQVRDSGGHISSASIRRALEWILKHGPELGIRIVSLSVSGDPVSPLAGNVVDEAVAALVDAGISVVAAAGNDGQRTLLPPATAPQALTVGGIDDKNILSHDEIALWHSNYGNAGNEVPKPDLVAPSIWVAAPVLPNSSVANEAQDLFVRRKQRDPVANGRIADLKLITPHYQHVEGTSFAAPIVASCIACLLEANPALTPLFVRDVLKDTAHLIPGADRERQGAGAVAPGQAVARALAERHSRDARLQVSPRLSFEGTTFSLHDHAATSVQGLGNWDGWRSPGIAARSIESGFWRTQPVPLPQGQYAYKFLLDGHRWLDDPNNPRKAPDDVGGPFIAQMPCQKRGRRISRMQHEALALAKDGMGHLRQNLVPSVHPPWRSIGREVLQDLQSQQHLHSSRRGWNADHPAIPIRNGNGLTFRRSFVLRQVSLRQSRCRKI